jgi:histidyl-tRNA synthetase
MKLPSVKGFRDVLPEESARWTRLEEQARRVFAAYDFVEIRIPIAERTDLFRRSIGETTDIVEKEMYTFDDRDGTSLTLRPEGTASLVRAYVEHSMHQRESVSRLFYMGPMFRRERPQKGRLRQFHQIGGEVLGRDDPAADAEVLLLLYDLLEAFGLSNANMKVNTLGCRMCRAEYRSVLTEWGRQRLDRLCDDCRRRLDQNPLRLLDCKQVGCLAERESAPRILDYTCEACRQHFERVLALLAGEDREPEFEPYMVRGLDYYCKTAFEVVAPGLGAQNAIGGGGRYDGLVRDLGGPDIGGVGFALGVERLILALPAQGQDVTERCEFAVLPLGIAAEPPAFRLAHRLRREGARVSLQSGTKSLKSQMRSAGRSASRYALILGENELASGMVTVRDMDGQRDYPSAVALNCPLADLRRDLDVLATRVTG